VRAFKPLEHRISRHPRRRFRPHGDDDAIANWSVAEARRAARAHAETLWALRGVPSASSVFIDTIDGLVGFAGRGLLIPTEV